MRFSRIHIGILALALSVAAIGGRALYLAGEAGPSAGINNCAAQDPRITCLQQIAGITPKFGQNPDGSTVVFFDTLLGEAQFQSFLSGIQSCGAGLEVLKPGNFTSAAVEQAMSPRTTTMTNEHRGAFVEGACSAAKIAEYAQAGVAISNDIDCNTAGLAYNLSHDGISGTQLTGIGDKSAVSGWPAVLCRIQTGPSGLLAHYTFDDGTAKDVSGNNNNGTPQNGATVVKKCMQFDGDNDRVQVPNFDRQTFTFAAWAKHEESPVGNTPELIVSNEAGGWGVGYHEQNGTFPPNVYLTKTQEDYTESDRTVPYDAFHHIAVTYDGSVAKFYIDGQLDSTKTYERIFDSNGDVYYLGWRVTTPPAVQYTAAFKGLMDDVRVYDRVLSGAEISQIASQKASCDTTTGGASSGAQGLSSGNSSDCLRIEVTGPATVQKGQQIVKSVTIKNTCTGTVTDVVVTDDIPQNLVYDAGSHPLCAVQGNQVRCTTSNCLCGGVSGSSRSGSAGSARSGSSSSTGSSAGSAASNRSSLRPGAGSSASGRVSSRSIDDICRLFPSRCSSVRSGGRCGDGWLDPGEACDDGNTVDNDQCANNCRRPPGFPCGDANQCTTGRCENICVPCTDNAQCSSNQCQNGQCVFLCGNGRIDSGEICDDGNRNDGDACANDCRRGNGESCSAVNQCASLLCTGNSCQPCGKHEQCGNGNLCIAQRCTPNPICGNGRREFSEACDDGNQIDDDRCSNSCRLGLTQFCSGNRECASLLCTNGSCSACSIDMQCPSKECIDGRCSDLCGNDQVDAGEDCDAGSQNSDLTPDACRMDCRSPRCGDSISDVNEQCDDGNTRSGDGCSATCQSEGPVVRSEVIDIPLSPFASGEGNGFDVNGNPIGSVTPIATGRPPAGNTGPAAIVVMVAGAAAGLAWVRRKRAKN